MSDSTQNKNLCHDCIFHIIENNLTECTNPDESGVNCSQVVFCSSFQPMQEIDSPCVTFGNDELSD